MGYEMGVARDKDLEQVEWFSCGWALTDLFKSLCTLSDEEPDEGWCGAVEVNLDAFAFIEDIASHRRGQDLIVLLDAIGKVDYDAMLELRESLPEVVQGAMKLSFVPAEDATSAEVEICQELSRLEDQDYLYIADGIAEAVERMRSDGLTTCYLFGG